MSTSSPVESLERGDRGSHLLHREGEWMPWMLPRIVYRDTPDGREYAGICRPNALHRDGWLSLPCDRIQDVPHCPTCSDAGFARFLSARNRGLL